jgi:hypothetical protein
VAARRRSVAQQAPCGGLATRVCAPLPSLRGGAACLRDIPLRGTSSPAGRSAIEGLQFKHQLEAVYPQVTCFPVHCGIASAHNGVNKPSVALLEEPVPLVAPAAKRHRFN